MSYDAFILITLVLFGFGLISKLLQGTLLTAPMIFVAVGLLASPLVFQVAAIDEEAAIVRFIAGLTLVLILFIDAMHIDKKEVWRNHLPRRLLIIGLPLSVVIGTLIAKGVFPDFQWWHAALLAILLTPTDPALGQQVVTAKEIPYRLREALNVESGLNDGLTLVALLLVLSIAEGAQHAHGALYWSGFLSMQILVGVGVGFAIGYLGGKAIEFCSKKDWMLSVSQQFSALILALLAYVLAEVLEGNGFISVFCAGFTLGIETPELRKRLFDFGEVQGKLFVLMTFLIFGAALIDRAFPLWNWMALLYAVLSLTVVRMVAVAISLIGAKTNWKEVLLLGWFGPRGLSSILFALLIMKDRVLLKTDFIFSIVVLTVFLSVFLHGATSKFTVFRRRAQEA